MRMVRNPDGVRISLPLHRSQLKQSLTVRLCLKLGRSPAMRPFVHLRISLIPIQSVSIGRVTWVDLSSVRCDLRN